MADLDEVVDFAMSKMDEHGLVDWDFRFDDAKRRFGVCKYGPRLIQISEPLARANSLTHCQDTILHEIAHALVGPGAGHGPVWQQMASDIGARPERCYDVGRDDIKEPFAPYAHWCPTCKHVVATRHRRPRKHYIYFCPTSPRDNRHVLELVKNSVSLPVWQRV